MIKEIESLQKRLEQVDFSDITIDDLADWKRHPVTQMFHSQLIGDFMKNLEFLNTNIPVDDFTRAQHAKIIGVQDATADVLNWADDEKASLEEENESNQN